VLTEIAISFNFALVIIYFVFIPIVYGASEFKINVTGSILLGVGYFLSFTAILL
jgi:hypothetical protein